MRLPVNQILPFAATMALGLALNACSAGGATTGAPASLPRTGPAGDYPVVIGEPFTIGDTTYRPDDQLNYDAVGMAVMDDSAALGISGAHKTLPLPSYAEVTSLDSGRTILVRLERRGPMDNDTLIGLSPAALAQLGATDRTAVRVRRVNPPEVERSALRMDNEVPVRMETPEPLLKVLRRKLAEQSPLGPPAATSPAMPSGMQPSMPPVTPDAKLAATDEAIAAAKPRIAPKPVAAEAKPNGSPAIAQVEPDQAASIKPEAKPEKVADAAPATGTAPPVAPAPAPPKSAQPEPATEAKPAGKNAVVVQVGAFSNEQGARKLAKKLGATVSRPGKYWLVRMGPFASRGEASTALEKAKAAGYSDARIQRMN